MLRRLALALLALAACPSTSTTDAGGAYPVVTSISPTSGPLTGGTVVTVNGVNFASGAVVKFDDVLGASVTFVDSRRLTVVSPAVTNPGVSAVSVTNPDGKSGTLPGAFTFQPVANHVIAQAVLLNPAAMSDTSGAAMVAVAVSAQVESPGVTGGLGQGAGLRAQVGWATTVSNPPAASDFTWSNATYLGDADGATAGDLARDAYSGTLMVPGATTGPVTYTLAARFSGDDGATWTIADRDGASNGVQAAQLSQLTVTKSSVDWCKLGGEAIEAPPMVSVRVGAAGPTVYGQVYRQGVTDMAGAGAQVKGQLGYGASGSDPSTWTWVDATFNRDTNNGANDEFMAALPVPAAGAYKFAFRFNQADGPWAYCDADGLANGGFSEDQAGSLTVTAPGVDRCNLQFPSTLTSVAGQPSALVYGRVFTAGLTEAAGPAAGLEGQLGFGPAADAPSAGSWTWTSTVSFNVDAMDGSDEYQARLTGPSPGTYAYAWRFRATGGAWTYCDLDGSGNGFQAAQAGVLTSTAPGTAISLCRLQSVSAFSVMSGERLTAAVRVVVPGVSGDAGVTPGLRVQLGVGPQGTNASASAAWGWGDGRYAAEATGGEEEWALSFSPAYTGNRAVAGRASLDDGGTWTYCDLNGSDVGGYEVTQQYDVTVNPHAGPAWCNLQFPATADAGTLVYGQVYLPGLTPDAGAPVAAELGLGVESEDPGLAWRWLPASFNVVSGNNNEYRRALPANAANGERYAFRYTVDGGLYCYGDLDGSNNGFSGGSNVGLVAP